jgi:hypothetical protein
MQPKKAPSGGQTTPCTFGETKPLSSTITLSDRILFSSLRKVGAKISNVLIYGQSNFKV